MKKVAVVLAVLLVGLMSLPAMAGRLTATQYYWVTTGNQRYFVYAADWTDYDDYSFIVQKQAVNRNYPPQAMAVRGRLENFIQPAYHQPQYYGGYGQAGGGYYQPQPYPHQYPQGYYQPQSPYPQYPQGGYYQPQQPTVVYQPAPQYGNPYGDFIEGIFVNAIGNIIDSAGNGAADRIYDEIARGGRRYRGYYRGGHYRR